MSQEKHSFTQRFRLFLLEKKISRCTFNPYSLILLLVLEHNGIHVLYIKLFWHVDFLFIQRSFLEGYLLSSSLVFYIVFSSILFFEEKTSSLFYRQSFFQKLLSSWRLQYPALIFRMVLLSITWIENTKHMKGIIELILIKGQDSTILLWTLYQPLIFT